jgi:ferrous iron transport protein B
MGVLFASIFWAASPIMDLIDSSFQYLSSLVVNEHNHHWYSDLLSSGIIGGAGAVLIFLPQIFILFFILGLLEDSGYLARGAMLIDKPLSLIGLNGRSFVPMLSGFACAIPAIMAARTITNRKERILTIFIIPLMSCSARLPVYGLLLTFLFPGKFLLSGIILSLIYLFGILTSFVVSSIINKYQKSFIKVEDNSSFIMELPVYRIPKFTNVLKNTYDNAYQYIRKAGPTIVVFSIIIWALTYFPNRNPVIYNSENMSIEQVKTLVDAERISNSYASELGKFIEPVMKPLGLDWRVGVSLIATFAAREIFVSSMALIFKITDNNDNLNESLVSAMRNAKIGKTDKPLFTISSTVGLIVFFVFAMQCISTIAITKKETGGWRIPILQVVVYSGLAYLFTFIVVNGLQLVGVN